MDDPAAIGRYLIVASFLAAGLGNLTAARIKDHIDRMAELRTPFPTACFWLGQTLLFLGCALLLANWHARIGVWCLIVFIVFATAIFHLFWRRTDPAKRNIGRIMFLNNTGILGGLVLLLGYTA